MSAGFDAYAKGYESLHDRNVALVGAESQEFVHDKLRWCSRFADRCFKATIETKTFLDYGCGVGRLGFDFHRYVGKSWNYIGFDPSEESIREAQEQYVARTEKSHAAEGSVAFHTMRDWSDNRIHYDFIFAACVFHHIEPNERESVLRRLWGTLKPNGVLVVWEHNPWNPITRKLVKECVFDHDACLLSIREMGRLWRGADATGPDAKTGHQFVTFFPGALHKLKPLESVLGWLPLGGQWVFWARKGA